jgi:hypothetical protein
MRVLIASLVVLALAAELSAQHRIGPIYPEKQLPQTAPPVATSGYDPFQLDWSTGRFVYVPIPYEHEPAGPNYNPFRFNWHSGRWDYVPYPGPGTTNESSKNLKSSEPLDQSYSVTIPTTPPAPTRPANAAASASILDSGQLISRPLVCDKPAARAVQSPSPTTQPLTNWGPIPRVYDPLRLNPAIGRWEYDDTTGRWKHYVP